MSAALSGAAHSIHVRLIRHAKDKDVDPNLVLRRFATERFLYRLSVSPHARHFVLKGGMLMLVWLGEQIRPTRDVDLLGFGDLADEPLVAAVMEVCAFPVQDDGLRFDPESIRIAAIRRDDPYGGRRVTVRALMGPAKIAVRIDIGIGDAVVPEPEWLEYPSLLDLPQPRLRAYRPETAIAEKLHAMVALGMQNSRMRDFFDIMALADHLSFDGEVLSRAVQNTFERRNTELPRDGVAALTPDFVAVPGKQAQWEAFLDRNRLTDTSRDLGQVVAKIDFFVGPLLAALAGGGEVPRTWPAGGPWQVDG